MSTRKRVYTTREEWLEAAAKTLRPVIEAHGPNIPKVRVSVGWPRGSRGGKGVHSIGQCWCKSASADGTHEIFISPEVDEPERVLDILAHELVHAAVGIPAGHGPKFARVAKSIGLKGRMTATVAGPEFLKFAEGACGELGRFPHARLGSVGGTSGKPKADSPKQSTRMRKAQCGGCGMVIRTTAKWIESTGLPECACGDHFEEAEAA